MPYGSMNLNHRDTTLGVTGEPVAGRFTFEFVVMAITVGMNGAKNG